MGIIHPLYTTVPTEYFTRADFALLAEPASSSAESNEARVRLKEKLMALHDEIYPRIRELRWDLYQPRPGIPLVSAARVTEARPQVSSLTLAYAKPETVIRLMGKAYGPALAEFESQAHLSIVLSAAGIAVELQIDAQAWVDGENFRLRALGGAAGKQHLRQMLAGCTPFTLIYWDPESGEITYQARSARLVALGVLDAALQRYNPRAHALRLRVLLPPGRLELSNELLPGYLLDRLAEVYPLYDYLAWSPRNNYCRR